MHRSFAWAPLATTTIAMTLMLGAVGCGDSNDDSDGAGSAANVKENTSVNTPATNTGRQAAINEVLVGIQNDFVKVDGASYCGRLTAAGIRQVEEFGKAYASGSDCVDIINTVARNTRDAGVEQKPSKLISVKFKGDRAIATIRNGGRPPEPMIFINDRGHWKIPDPGFQTNAGSKPLPADFADRIKQARRTQEAVKRRLQSGNGQ